MILILETSTELCSVAIADADGNCKALMKGEKAFSHAEKLPGMVLDILEQSNLTTANLSAIGISGGPGSYTGLRIGTSIAKGICYASQIPLMSLSGMRAMALKAKEFFPKTQIFLSNLDARRNEFFMQLFDAQLNVAGELRNEFTGTDVLKDFAGNEITICGNASQKIADGLGASYRMNCIDILPDAAYLCQEAGMKFTGNEFEDLAYFEPTYVKAVHIMKGKSQI